MWFSVIFVFIFIESFQSASVGQRVVLNIDGKTQVESKIKKTDRWFWSIKITQKV